ncbi:hypothetical protein BC834DRAFT_436416 [Gloeopeniophorella convolvens]|nr:hypothetical protein BC834DRAFT_436416 [Gloeopeniophorella convolvens]
MAHRLLLFNVRRTRELESYPSVVVGDAGLTPYPVSGSSSPRRSQDFAFRAPSRTGRFPARVIRHLSSRPGLERYEDLARLSIEELCRKAERQLGIPGAEVSLLTNDPADIKAAVDLAVGVFCEREPLTRQLALRNPALTRESMTTFCTAIAYQGAQTNLSPIVKVGGDVIGVLLATPFEHTPPPSEAPAGIEPLYDVLQKLGVEFDAHVVTRSEKPRFIEWAIGAVDGRFQGFRVLSVIPQLTMKNAQTMGFTDALTKASSHSQNIFSKLGWKTISELSYLTYEYEGERCFADILPHDMKQIKLQVIDMETFWRKQHDYDATQRERGSKTSS